MDGSYSACPRSPNALPTVLSATPRRAVFWPSISLSKPPNSGQLDCNWTRSIGHQTPFLWPPASRQHDSWFVVRGSSCVRNSWEGGPRFLRGWLSPRFDWLSVCYCWPMPDPSELGPCRTPLDGRTIGAPPAYWLPGGQYMKQPRGPASWPSRFSQILEITSNSPLPPGMAVCKSINAEGSFGCGSSSASKSICLPQAPLWLACSCVASLRSAARPVSTGPRYRIDSRGWRTILGISKFYTRLRQSRRLRIISQMAAQPDPRSRVVMTRLLHLYVACCWPPTGPQTVLNPAASHGDCTSKRPNWRESNAHGSAGRQLLSSPRRSPL